MNLYRRLDMIREYVLTAAVAIALAFLFFALAVATP